MTLLKTVHVGFRTLPLYSNSLCERGGIYRILVEVLRAGQLNVSADTHQFNVTLRLAAALILTQLETLYRVRVK